MESSSLQFFSPSGYLQNEISINNAADLRLSFDQQANAGDQVEMFFAMAEGDPVIALISFIPIVKNYTSSPIKSLAIQGLGKIANSYRQELASCASQESQELLKLLCDEIKSSSSDLIAWAAAEALQKIGFLPENIQHREGGNLSEPPLRIQNEIVDRKIREIDKINRYNSQKKFTAEYERFLEFWIYGPTTRFFEEDLISKQYLNIAEDILEITELRGFQLGLNAVNLRVRELALSRVIKYLNFILNLTWKITNKIWIID